MTPLTPRRFGSCAAMMTSDIAAVKPTSTGRESRSARNPRCERPREQHDRRDLERENGCEPRRAGDIPVRHRRDRGRREDRARRRRSHLRLADRARQPVGEPGDRRRVEADDRRQPRQAGIRKAAGHRCRPHRHAGACVPAQVAHAVAVQRAERRQQPLQPPRPRRAWLWRGRHHPRLQRRHGSRAGL